MACLAYSKSSYPLNITILISGNSALTMRLNSSPSINGIRISVIRISGFSFKITGSASSPSLASPTNSYPSFSQSILFLILWRIIISSSTKYTFTIFIILLFYMPARYKFHLTAAIISALLFISSLPYKRPPCNYRRNFPLCTLFPVFIRQLYTKPLRIFILPW